MPFVDLSQPDPQNQTDNKPGNQKPQSPIEVTPQVNVNEPSNSGALPDIGQLQKVSTVENSAVIEQDSVNSKPQVQVQPDKTENVEENLTQQVEETVGVSEQLTDMRNLGSTKVSNKNEIQPEHTNHTDDYGLLEKAPEELKQGASQVREIKGPPLPDSSNSQDSPDESLAITPDTNIMGTGSDVQSVQGDNSLANDIAKVMGESPEVDKTEDTQSSINDVAGQDLGANVEDGSVSTIPTNTTNDMSSGVVVSQDMAQDEKKGVELPPLDSILGDSTAGLNQSTPTPEVTPSVETPANSIDTQVDDTAILDAEVKEPKTDDPNNTGGDQATDSVGQPKDKTKSFNPARVLTNFNAATASMEDFMAYTIANNSSDLHIAADYPAFIRVDGHLRQIPGEVMSQDRVQDLIYQVLSEEFKKELKETKELDLSYQHPSGDRFRINVFYKQGTLSAALRLIPSKIRTISELALPEILYDFIKIPNGLVLVTGPTGSGKSTTIAAMLQEINVNRAEHIITIEDPIEYVYPRMKSLVEQREIGKDTLSWTGALRSALRQDPNIVLVGEMRDYETIESAVTIAETGHLVFATLHTNSASQTIDRIIDVFPEGQQSQIRAQLANVVVGVVSQRLIPVKSGGRKAVHEIMTGTSAVKNAIREEKTYQIDNIIQTSSEVGMQTLETSLVKLIRAGEITMEEALNYTLKADELRSLLKTM